jgi:hypothetical protein
MDILPVNFQPIFCSVHNSYFSRISFGIGCFAMSSMVRRSGTSSSLSLYLAVDYSVVEIQCSSGVEEREVMSSL